MAKDGEAKIKIVSDSSQAETDLQKFSKSLQRLGDTSDVASRGLQKFGGASSEVASEGEKTGGRWSNLWQSMRKNTGSAIDDMAKDHKVLGGAMKDLGITGDSVMAKALPAAAAAGAGAVAVFTAKAIGNFSELATETDKLSVVSNLSAQDASRWIEVAGDWGVSADTLTGQFGKLGKAIGSNPAVLKEHSIELGRTKSGALDMGATMNNVLDAIRNTSDASKKDEMAQKLLGRSYAELAPLIALTREEREKALKSVAAGKVVTEADIKANRELKQAFDSIKDAGENVSNTWAKVMMPAIGAATGQLSKAADGISGATDAIGRHLPWVHEETKSTDQLSTSVAGLAETHREQSKVLADNSVAQEKATAAQALADKQVQSLKRSIDTLAKAEDDAKRSIEDRTRAVQDSMGAGTGWARTQLDIIAKERDLKDAMAASAAQHGRNVELNLKAQLAGEELNAMVRQAAIDFAALQGVQKTSNAYIPTQIQGLNELKAKFPELSTVIDEYIAKLAAIPKTIVTSVSVDQSGNRGAPGYPTGPTGKGPYQSFSAGGFGGGAAATAPQITVIAQMLTPTPEAGRVIGEAVALAMRTDGAVLPKGSVKI